MRYLRARRKTAFISITTFFTAIGVTIGVAALVTVLAVMNGFEANLRARVLNLSPQIQILSFEGSITNYDDIEAKALKVPDVTGAAAFVIGQGMLSSGRGVGGVVVRGIDIQSLAGTHELRRYIQRGELASLGQVIEPTPGNPTAPNGALAIGEELAQKLKVKVGDVVRVVSPILAQDNGEITARSGNFTVGAIFDSGAAFVDRTVVFMGLKNAQRFFGREGRVDGIELRLKDLDDTQSATVALRNLFPYPYRVRNWIEFNQAATAGFAMLKRVYSLVLLMLIAVAAFNLVATLIMTVMEKRKDIAILMTMGATRGGIRLIFVLKGLVLGGVGTLAGLILGAVACFALANYHFVHIPKDIYGISSLPVDASVWNFGAVAAASMILCLMASFYPARQASRQLPVEVIRYE
ncbi:MAG TPA: ABC transporter permease [Candidatus Binataceae bacterium]|nr:ABC transporter permease [Candidatus Binataceae bacterium]